jgi:hypothetical protein
MALALASLTACGTPAATGPTPLPADVQAIVDARCASCHAAPPGFGAPMPLGTWESMHAAAVTDPSREVFELVGARIHDARRPMPASGMLPASELATLDAWIAAGAPPGSGSVSTNPPPVQVGPAYLPCTPSAEFRAHAPGDPSTPYHLPVGAGATGNATMCFAFASPFGATTQGTAFAPILDDARVLHHWIIFASDTLPAGVSVGDAWECGASGGLTMASQFITGWAPGGQNQLMPSDQGRELPPTGQYVILQVHYWNVAGYVDVNDRSGVAVCTTDTPRPNLVATSTLGSLDIQIPPRAVGHTVVGTCTPDITAPVTIVGAGPHMHTHGVTFRTEVLRGGSTTNVETLVDIGRWDFNGQTGYAAPNGALVIQPGDVLRTTCTYDNGGDTDITFGERTEDEMCFDFVSAYPAGALANALGRARRLCID